MRQAHGMASASCISSAGRAAARARSASCSSSATASNTYLPVRAVMTRKLRLDARKHEAQGKHAGSAERVMRVCTHSYRSTIDGARTLDWPAGDLLWEKFARGLL